MKRKHILAAFVALAMTTTVVLATPLRSTAARLINYVTLQPTPGTPETGYVNLNGTVYVANNDPSGVALNAAVTGATSTGISLSNTKTTGLTFGMLMTQASPDGEGIHVSAAGVGIESLSSNKVGILVNSSVDDGISSRSGGSYRSGVYGYATAANGNGGWFATNATTGTGVGVGGVQGSNNGFAVWASGRYGGTGTKAFQIDDPTDPENYTLTHYSTEGPEPLNFYSGNVSTNSRGYATVTLPDYFPEINRDFRYQLTVVDDKDSADFVMAKVAKEIKGNKFVVRTSAPNVKVSWRVEAIRNDRWVKKHGAPIRELKLPENRGKYLEPGLYGKPSSKSIFPHSAPTIEVGKPR